MGERGCGGNAPEWLCRMVGEGAFFYAVGDGGRYVWVKKSMIT